MTTPIEALELRPCPFCGGEAESDSARNYRNISTGTPEKAAAIYCTSCSAHMTWCYRDTPEIERDQVMTLLIEQWNARALASLEGDAVERVAQLIEDHVTAHCDDERCQTWIDNSRDAAEAILATGLVAGEAAIRADEREKCATYRNALLWAFDRLSVTGANEQRRTMREIGNVLTGKASPAATYQPNDWDDSAAIRSGDVA